MAGLRLVGDRWAGRRTGPAGKPGHAGLAVSWVMSGKTTAALHEQAARLHAHLNTHPDLALADVGATLAHQAVFDHRAVVTGESRDDLLTGLAELAGIDDTSTESGSRAAKGNTGVRGWRGRQTTQPLASVGRRDDLGAVPTAAINLIDHLRSTGEVGSWVCRSFWCRRAGVLVGFLHAWARAPQSDRRGMLGFGATVDWTYLRYRPKREDLVSDLSSAVDQLRAQQRRLVEVVDAFEATTAGSTDYDRLFGEVTLVHQVVATRNGIPLRRHQADHDRYDMRVRVLGGVVAVAALVALVGVVVHWISGGLVLLALPLLVIGGRLAVTGAGSRNQIRPGGTPTERLVAAVASLIAVAALFVTAFVTWWALTGAIVGVVVAAVAAFVSVALATPARTDGAEGRAAE